MLRGERYTMLAAVFAAYHMQARPRLWQRSEGKGAYTALAEALGSHTRNCPRAYFPSLHPFALTWRGARCRACSSRTSASAPP